MIGKWILGVGAACMLAAGLVITQLPAAGAAPAIPEAAGPMTHRKFAAYIEIFNRGDLRFVEFYHPDVVFDKVHERLVGRAALAQWYAKFWSGTQERVTPSALAIDVDGKVMMAEIRIDFEAKKDGVRSDGKSLSKGDRYFIRQTIVYSLKDGLILGVRKTEETSSPQTEEASLPRRQTE